jgi:hypothetical protein
VTYPPPIAEPFRLVEVVRGEEDRQLAVTAQVGDHVEKLGADQRVETDGRLVEEEDTRARDEGAHDLEPAPLPAAEGADRPLDEIAQSDDVDELLDPAPRGRGLDTPQPGMEVEVAPAREGAVDHGVLEHDTAHPARLERLLADVEAGEAGSTARRADGRREHPDRRRLARPVRAEQAEHLARRHLEVDLLDRFDAAVVHLAELVHLDHSCPPVTSVGRASSLS